MPRSRVRFRPPGLKPWTRVGTLGPFRGRLGLAWVIAPLVLGVILLAFSWFFLIRTQPPGGAFVRAGDVTSFEPARTIDLGGALITVRLVDGGVATAAEAGSPCPTYPTRVFRGSVYVDLQHPRPCDTPSGPPGITPLPSG